MEPVNLTWQQGEDLTFSLIYRTGPTGQETAPDLSTGYSLRMDIVSPTGERLYTFNSETLADVDPNTPGDQPEVPATSEAVLGPNGAIDIAIDRAVTLPGGPIYDKLNEVPPVNVFYYDIFLRATAPTHGEASTVGRQQKILKGSITVETSYTLWP